MFDGLVLAIAAATQSVAQAPATPEESPPIVIRRDRPDKKVCKKSRAPTGSRLGSRRICRTEFEWEMAREAAKRALEQHERHEQAMHAHKLNQKNGLADDVEP